MIASAPEYLLGDSSFKWTKSSNIEAIRLLGHMKIMFEPKCLIRLDEKIFSKDRMVCLGLQLKDIVCKIGELRDRQKIIFRAA